MAVALIVAAGRGERLGHSTPKALVEIAGRTLLDWSVEAVRAVQSISATVVALPADRLDRAPAGVSVVAGGATRSESVKAALALAPADDVVVVHDAARVLVKPELFVEAIELLISSGADAVIAAAPVHDTIKEVAVGPRSGGGLRVTRTIDRSRLWAVQTPQVFRRQALASALDAPTAVLAGATDDAWLVEQAGGKVVILPSSAENIKITNPFDLTVAEAVLKGREQ